MMMTEFFKQFLYTTLVMTGIVVISAITGTVAYVVTNFVLLIVGAQ